MGHFLGCFEGSRLFLSLNCLCSLRNYWCGTKTEKVKIFDQLTSLIILSIFWGCFSKGMLSNKQLGKY
jgi:hypothetical protein